MCVRVLCARTRTLSIARVRYRYDDSAEFQEFISMTSMPDKATSDDTISENLLRTRTSTSMQWIHVRQCFL